MRSRRAADSLADGFEPYALPAPGPDGSLALPPQAPAPIPPPRICEYGPCRNYHTFQIVMDAQKPVAGAILEGGQLVGDAARDPDRVERQHYCYPTVGVETDLGATPVVSCNRWRPQGLITIGVRRRYRRDLEQWQADQDAAVLAEVAHIEEAASALAEAEAARAADSSIPPT